MALMLCSELKKNKKTGCVYLYLYNHAELQHIVSSILGQAVSRKIYVGSIFLINVTMRE